MFMGEYSHTIDTKGRLIVPSKFRESLGDSFVVTKGLDGCLFVYDMTEWKSFEEKLKELPMSHRDTRKFARFFLAGASQVEVDKQGRILIPNVLREFAGLEKMWYSSVSAAELKSGAGRHGMAKVTSMIWMISQSGWRIWD